YEHLDEQTPKLRENLAAHEEQVRRNAGVMVLRRDVPLDVGPEDLALRGFDRDEVRKLFDFLEFRSLHDRLAEAFPADGAAPAGLEVLEAEVTVVDDPAEAAELLGRLAGGRVEVVAAWEGAAGRSPLEGLAVVTGPVLGEVAWLPAAVLADERVEAALGAIESFAAHGAKPVLRSLAALGVELPA